MARHATRNFWRNWASTPPPGYCLYIRRLSDVDLPVLEQIVQESYEFVESKSQDGPIRQILWKTEG